MKRSHSALWSANVDLKKNSQLKEFCNQLEKKIGEFKKKGISFRAAFELEFFLVSNELDGLIVNLPQKQV